MPGLPVTPYSAMRLGQHQDGTGQGSPGTPIESGSLHTMQHLPFPYTTFTYPNHSHPQYPSALNLL